MNIDNIINRLDKKEDIEVFIEVFSYISSKFKNIDEFRKEILFNNILGTINILLNFNADCLTLVSYLLSLVIDFDREDIKDKFGTSVYNIAFEVSKIVNFYNSNDMDNYNNSLGTLESDNEIDFRILFILLGDVIYKLNVINELDNKYKKKIAYDTLYNLTPTAGRLRLYYIKSKLEDLCLYYLKPDEYNNILVKLNATPSTLDISLNNMKNDIVSLLEQYNIKYEIKSRVKNIYSIYNKLSCGKDWGDIYDILAIRIIVDNEYECSLIADLIHSKYRYIPSRFKDYISVPKENRYQSLHTTIIGEDNRYYEIQIRTHKMNRTAEVGDASHHKYKQRKLKKINI